MKSASELAEEIVKSLPQYGDIEGLRGSLADQIAQALTAYANEKLEHQRVLLNKVGMDEAEQYGYSKGRAEAIEDCAKVADDFGWKLPLYEKKCCNEASDDSACSATEQVAKVIRALAAGKP